MPRLIRLAGVTAIAVLLFALCTRTMADPDLWGHLRFGLDTLVARGVTSVDPYSFTQDRPWINHEWLSELQMALAYRTAGIAGLSLLKGTLVFVALWMVWRALRGADLIARMLAGGLVVLATGSITSTLRPQLWSMLSMTALCVLLQDGGPRRRWCLPLLFAFWANLHGGWVVGLGVLCAWAATAVFSDRSRPGEWLTTVGLSVAATLITPYGWSLWSFLLNTVRPTRDITEWQPLFAGPLMNWLPVVLVFVIAACLLPSVRIRRIPIAVALALLAYGAWRVSRIGPLFVVAAATWLGPTIARRWPQRPIDLAPLGSHAASVLISGACLGAIVAAALIATRSLRCIVVEGQWTPPPGAVHLLTSARAAGRVVTLFDWGQYALWHLGPRLRVSMDGRRETVYSDARIAEHDAIVKGSDDGLRALDAWRAEYVWLPATSATTKAWLAAHGYRIDLDARDAFLAVRDDIPPWTAPVDTPVRLRCFPQ